MELLSTYVFKYVCHSLSPAVHPYPLQPNTARSLANARGGLTYAVSVLQHKLGCNPYRLWAAVAAAAAGRCRSWSFSRSETHRNNTSACPGLGHLPAPLRAHVSRARRNRGLISLSVSPCCGCCCWVFGNRLSTIYNPRACEALWAHAAGNMYLPDCKGLRRINACHNLFVQHLGSALL